MKLGLLGDIHGNHLALKAVLDSAKSRHVDRLLIAGDLVGYYFWPKEVLDLLVSFEIEAVGGNHEEILTKARREPEFLVEVDQLYGVGIRTALETLSQSQLDWLALLPHPRKVIVGDCTILLCHGSPWNINQYIYPDAETALMRQCTSPKYDWIVLGHTHYPMELTKEKTRIVNPGSVGQPRNREPGAHWALLDTNSGSYQHLVERYDIDWVVDQTRSRQPDMSYLWDTLVRT